MRRMIERRNAVDVGDEIVLPFHGRNQILLGRKMMLSEGRRRGILRRIDASVASWNVDGGETLSYGMKLSRRRQGSVVFLGSFVAVDGDHQYSRQLGFRAQFAGC